MDKQWLERELAAGRSIESIAREVGKHPSTVAYWVNKHGLVSEHAERYAAKGRVDQERLRGLVERGMSVRQIGTELDLSAAAVRHWLRKYGLKTVPSNYVLRDSNARGHMRECPQHGWVAHRRIGRGGSFRCASCASEAVIERRRRVKEILVEEAGGCCVACGYDRYAGALQFHHVDPGEKSFDVGGRGLTRSLDVLRAEAAKCVLVCANCHAEVEAGLTQLPFRLAGREHPG